MLHEFLLYAIYYIICTIYGCYNNASYLLVVFSIVVLHQRIYYLLAFPPFLAYHKLGCILKCFVCSAPLCSCICICNICLEGNQQIEGIPAAMASTIKIYLKTPLKSLPPIELDIIEGEATIYEDILAKAK